MKRNLMEKIKNQAKNGIINAREFARKAIQLKEPYHPHLTQGLIDKRNNEPSQREITRRFRAVGVTGVTVNQG